MSSSNVIRAWKDEDYRLSLSEAERAKLPENPAGLIELSDEDLSDATGATTTTACLSVITAVTVLASCSGNCDTVFRGTCGAYTVGCCPEPPPV